MTRPRPAWLERIQANPAFYYALGVLLLAVLVLLPLLGTFGLWDPQEFPLADLAREVQKTGDYSSVAGTRPPLTVWLSAWGISLLGPSELGVRLPHALLAIFGALSTYSIGRRLRTPRAGLFAAAALIASPLYLFQARQLTTDMGAIAGSAIAMNGLIGLAWPERGRRGGPVFGTLVDAILVVIGLGLGYLGQGAVLGVGVPLGALAVVCAAAFVGRFFVEENETDVATHRRLLVVAIAAGAVAATIAVLWYDKQDQTGFSRFLGGAFRAGKEPPPSSTFDYLVNQVAWGMFPWSALAPVAIVRLLLVRRADRAAWGGLLLVAWAALAYVVGALWVREMGDLRFIGMVPIALAIGVLVDDLLAARGSEPARWPAAQAGLPLLGLFVACAAIQLGRDIREFPEQLASVHLLQDIKFPAVVVLPRVLMLGGIFFGLLAAVGIASASRPELAHREPLDTTGLPAPAAGLVGGLRLLGTWMTPVTAPVMAWLRANCLVAAIALGVGLGGFLSLVYTPTLSQHFSYKNVFDTYQHRHKAGEPIGVMGIPGSGPDFYGGDTLERLNDQGALTAFLRRAGRVFAVAPATEICGLHQQAVQNGFEYYVANAQNSRFYLYTNELGAGEKDANPLSRFISREPPANIRQPVSAKYVPASGAQGGELELLGVDLPRSARKGRKFTVKLYFKVNAKVSTNYQVFVHFDKGVRFQGDHWPANNVCGTQYWQMGDYVTDTFEVTAGDTFSPKGAYDVYMGLFTGGGGNWRNMTVTTGNADKNNRVKIGTLELR